MAKLYCWRKEVYDHHRRCSPHCKASHKCNKQTQVINSGFSLCVRQALPIFNGSALNATAADSSKAEVRAQARAKPMAKANGYHSKVASKNRRNHDLAGGDMASASLRIGRWMYIQKWKKVHPMVSGIAT